MIVDDFNSADPRTWLARGRTPEQAEALAASWRDFPDLPHDAPLADRQARSRARVIATRPIFEAMRVQAEAERQARAAAVAAQATSGGWISASSFATSADPTAAESAAATGVPGTPRRGRGGANVRHCLPTTCARSTS